MLFSTRQNLAHKNHEYERIKIRRKEEYSMYNYDD